MITIQLKPTLNARREIPVGYALSVWRTGYCQWNVLDCSSSSLVASDPSISCFSALGRHRKPRLYGCIRGIQLSSKLVARPIRFYFGYESGCISDCSWSHNSSWNQWQFFVFTDRTNYSGLRSAPNFKLTN